MDYAEDRFAKWLIIITIGLLISPTVIGILIGPIFLIRDCIRFIIEFVVR